MPIVHSLSESAKEGLALMQGGAPALKHGRAGKPHLTTFTLSQDETVLSWKSGGGTMSKIGGSMRRLSGSGSAPLRILQLNEVVELLVGRDSSVFKRRANDTGNEHLSLSLVLRGALPAPPSAGGKSDAPEPTRETLDLSFDDELDFGLWVAALRHLLKKQQTSSHAQKEDALKEQLFRAQSHPSDSTVMHGAMQMPALRPVHAPSTPPPNFPPIPQPANLAVVDKLFSTATNQAWPVAPSSMPAAASLDSVDDLMRSQSLFAAPPSEDWQLEPAAVAKYVALFEEATAAAGGVSSLAKSQAGFHRSGLDVDALMQIWTLADIDGDDRLNLKEYLISCFLTTRCVRHQLPPPASLPPELIESATHAAAMNPMLPMSVIDGLFGSAPTPLVVAQPVASPTASSVDDLFRSASKPAASSTPVDDDLFRSTSFFGSPPSGFGDTYNPAVDGVGASSAAGARYGGGVQTDSSGGLMGGSSLPVGAEGVMSGFSSLGLGFSEVAVTLDVSDGSNILDAALPSSATFALPSGDDALMKGARAHEKAVGAMSALQALMTAKSAGDLQNAIYNAQMVPGVPTEALHVARKRHALMMNGEMNGRAAAASTGEYLQQQMGAIIGEMTSKLDMMASLQAKLEAMQMLQIQLEQENDRLRSGGGVGKRGPRMSYVEEEDEQEREERLTREGYEAAKAAVMEALSKGKMPSAEQYLERDVHLYKLADAEIQAEYVWYTGVYLADETAANVRGMAEMTLIKVCPAQQPTSAPLNPWRVSYPCPSPCPTPSGSTTDVRVAPQRSSARLWTCRRRSARR